jgi:hypothetical protein
VVYVEKDIILSEQKLGVSQWSKNEEVTAKSKRLRNKELRTLYPSPNTIRVIKPRRMRWAEHVARLGEKRGAHRVLVKKPEGKKPLGRSRHRWGDIIKICFQKVKLEEWTGLIWGKTGTGLLRMQ